MSGNIISIAKNLRKRSTDAENLLRGHLRANQLEGLKFRRQQPIGNNEVLMNIEGVLEVIRENCISPSPNPSHQGGEN